MSLKTVLKRARRHRLLSEPLWRAATPIFRMSEQTAKWISIKVKRNHGTVRFGPHRIVFPPDVGVDFVSAIHWHGEQAYEPSTWATLKALLPSAQSFFDIGANIGIYSVLARKTNPRCQIYAFEPVPEIFNRAQAFFRANGLTNEVSSAVLEQVAISDADGAATLFLPHEEGLGSTAGSLRTGEWQQIKPHDEVQVAVKSLDTFVKGITLGDGPVVLKIDVEDHEAAVLRGGREFLRGKRPVIVCEILPRGHGNQETAKEIAESELAPFAITDQGLFRISPSDLARNRSVVDFLLFPQEMVGDTATFLFGDLKDVVKR